MRKIGIKAVEMSSSQGRDIAMIDVPGNQKVRRGSHKASGTNVPLKFFRNVTGTKFVTGLEKMVLNPFHKDVKKTTDVLPSNWFKHETWLKEQVQIPLQYLLEIEYEQDRDTLDTTVRSPTMTEIYLNKDKSKGVVLSFIESFTFYISPTSTTVLDSRKGLKEALAVQAALHAPFIAKEVGLVNTNHHMFYIANIDELNADSDLERKQIMKSAVKLEDLESNYTSLERYKFAVVLKIATQNEISDNIIIGDLRDYIWNSKKDIAHGTLTDRIIRFNKTYDVFKTASDKFLIEYLFNQALNTQTWKFDAGKVYWPKKREFANLYELGGNIVSIKNRLLIDKQNFDELSGDDNLYKVLTEELKAKQVLI